jgi:hypothetical protein
MFHSKSVEANPIAHITKNKSRLKVYNETNIYLNDKDNFEIEIFNPTKSPILCKIKLNGNYISNSGIVLRPAERVFLDRFIDSNGKFLFNTYEVNDTPQNKSAIEFNGNVSIEFFKEHSPVFLLGTLSTTAGTYYPPIYNTSTSWVTDTSNITNYSSTITSSLSTSIETGRIEKGGKSDQKFSNVSMDFESFSFHTIKYKILPKSNKNVTMNEIRNYCSECGRKLKKEYKFCPSCGHKL